jgi:hypothetical protein
MKKFMAFWAVARRFKALISVGLLTIIPFINVLATWIYAAANLSFTHTLQRIMQDNLSEGRPAFDKKTRQIWISWFAEVSVVLIFTTISVSINHCAVEKWPTLFDAQWITSWNGLHWFEIAAWALSLVCITWTFVSKINAIYETHRDYDPEYMDADNSVQQKRREELLAKRAEHQAAVKAQ